MIEAVPESNMMLHGDYHTNNVHYANGEAILIDMDTLATGNPVFEFASIFLAYEGYGELDKSKVEDFLKIDWDTAQYILYKLIDLYYEDKDEEFRKSVLDKAKVIGYTRALRRTIKRNPDDKELIEHYKKELIEYVDKVDELAL